jgi:hypothetical protein
MGNRPSLARLPSAPINFTTQNSWILVIDLELLLLNPDRGDRYIETVYNADWLEKQNIRLSSDAELVADIAALQPVPFNILHRSNSV